MRELPNSFWLWRHQLLGLRSASLLLLSCFQRMPLYSLTFQVFSIPLCTPPMVVGLPSPQTSNLSNLPSPASRPFSSSSRRHVSAFQDLSDKTGPTWIIHDPLISQRSMLLHQQNYFLQCNRTFICLGPDELNWFTLAFAYLSYFPKYECVAYHYLIQLF